MIVILGLNIICLVAGVAALASWAYGRWPNSRLAVWFDRWAGNYSDDLEEEKWNKRF